MALSDDIALYALGRWMHESRPNRIDDLCLNHIQWKSTCTACSDVCPAEIDVHSDHVAWAACTGCNACIAACPTSALNESRSSFEDIVSALDNSLDYTVFACDLHDGPCDVRRPCLGMLPWDLLAGVAVSQTLVMKLQHCSSCPHAQLVQQTKELVRTLKTFLGPDFFAQHVTMKTPAEASEEVGLRKRRAFMQVAHTVQSEAASILEDIDRDAPTMSCYRAFLLDALEQAQPSPEVTWKVLEEDGNCRACGACVAMCPHHALSLELPDDPHADDAPQARLVQDATRCTQCGMCYVSCPEETIGGWSQLRAAAAEARVEFPLDVAYCEKCGNPFKPASGETRCTNCSRFRFL